MNPDAVLTVKEVARYLKVTPKTVYSLVKSGKLESFRVGRAVRCQGRAVQAFMAVGATKSGGEERA
jgi:putative molybdopterin biosynthesis protein